MGGSFTQNPRNFVFRFATAIFAHLGHVIVNRIALFVFLQISFGRVIELIERGAPEKKKWRTSTIATDDVMMML